MRRQGGGIVINITSSAGDREIDAPIGKGGWGLGYSLSKAAFNRMVPGLAKELRADNIAVIGLMPGFVGTERMAIELADFGFDASRGLPVENPGRVCAMLATAADPLLFSGKDIYGPLFHAEHAAVRFETPRSRGPCARMATRSVAGWRWRRHATPPAVPAPPCEAQGPRLPRSVWPVPASVIRSPACPPFAPLITTAAFVCSRSPARPPTP
jgi:hypothetical protein